MSYVGGKFQDAELGAKMLGSYGYHATLHRATGGEAIGHGLINVCTEEELDGIVRVIEKHLAWLDKGRIE